MINYIKYIKFPLLLKIINCIICMKNKFFYYLRERFGAGFYDLKILLKLKY